MLNRISHFLNLHAFNMMLLAGVMSLASFTVRAAPHIDGTDAQFVTVAGQGNQAEVALGHLALKKSQDTSVRELALRIIRDHSKAEKQLLKITHSSGLKIPAKLNSEQSKLRNRLAGLNGNAFDKAYIDATVEDHKKDIDEFSTAAANAHDTQVKQYANQSLPTLKTHLQMAETIARSQPQ